MTKILAALDAITARVLAYRPANKGQAVDTAAAKADEARKRKGQDDRESSI